MVTQSSRTPGGHSIHEKNGLMKCFLGCNVQPYLTMRTNFCTKLTRASTGVTMRRLQDRTCSPGPKDHSQSRTGRTEHRAVSCRTPLLDKDLLMRFTLKRILGGQRSRKNANVSTDTSQTARPVKGFETM